MEPFTDLVLLIGTNPLPNFVVAKYFLENNRNLKHIWLIHSEKNQNQAGTDVQANCLEKVLHEQYKSKKEKLFPLKKRALSNVSNAKLIFDDVNTKFISQLSRENTVHLNYTGGTKAMGIHVYRAIEQENKKSLGKSYSYLDGRNFQIVNDANKIITDNLRDKISIDFKTLIELHGFFRCNNEKSDVDFTGTIEAFKNLINEGKLDQYYSEKGGYNRILFENKDKPGELAKEVKKLKIEELNAFTPNDVFASIIDSMPEGYRLFQNKKFVAPATNNPCKNAIKFLDGGWFEEYVFTIFKDALNSSYTIDKNWEIKKEGWNTYFELDVIILKGYQLIGVSCTTSNNKSECKNKGFEIIHRTSQIGGDEAKAILVTSMCSEQKKTLEEELKVETGSTSANILVLGKDDWREDIFKEEINIFLKGK